MPRELIEPHKDDKRYVRRKKGKFSTRQTEVGRSFVGRSPIESQNHREEGRG